MQGHFESLQPRKCPCSAVREKHHPSRVRTPNRRAPRDTERALGRRNILRGRRRRGQPDVHNLLYTAPCPKLQFSPTGFIRINCRHSPVASAYSELVHGAALECPSTWDPQPMTMSDHRSRGQCRHSTLQARSGSSCQCLQSTLL